jgi:hypothetical protein
MRALERYDAVRLGARTSACESVTRAARQAIFMVQTAEDRRGEHLCVIGQAMTG